MIVEFPSPAMWLRTQRFELINLSRFVKITVEKDGEKATLKGYLDQTNCITLYESSCDYGNESAWQLFDIIDHAIRNPYFSSADSDFPTPNPGYIDYPRQWKYEREKEERRERR